MTTIEIIGTGTAGIVAAGAYLKWAVRPVTIAYQLGRAIGKRSR